MSRKPSSHVLLLVFALSGCGSKPEAPKIIPDSAKARWVVHTMMAAWKSGNKSGMIDSTSPRIQVIDSFRKPGQKLEGYEIVAETVSDRTRDFSIRLQLSGSEESPIVRYLILGIDPILVFREEDYELIAHWEHKMEPENGEETSAPVPK